MGWIIFAIVIWSTALILVPLKCWKISWPVGVFGLLSIYAIDSTLVYLGAFRFWHGNIYLSGLPLFYWLGYFPGSIVFDRFRPKKHVNRIIYILIFAAAYLAVELAMIYLGYFQHFRWNPVRSYLLNVTGFTIAMWFAEWLEEGRNRGTAKKVF